MVEKDSRARGGRGTKAVGYTAADESNHRLNREVAKLTSRLGRKQTGRASYFQAESRDKRYLDHNFDYVLSQESEMNSDSFHDLRHTHVTLLLKGGVHPKIVSERLRHVNSSVTVDTYSHILPGLQERMVAGSSDLASMGR